MDLRTGRPGKLPPPVAEDDSRLTDPRARALFDSALSCSVVGGPDAVRRGLAEFAARTRPDELMVTAPIHDHAARRRSFEILAGLHAEMAAAA